VWAYQFFIDTFSFKAAALFSIVDWENSPFSTSQKFAGGNGRGKINVMGRGTEDRGNRNTFFPFQNNL
jgi:hypothetical protein